MLTGMRCKVQKKTGTRTLIYQLEHFEYMFDSKGSNPNLMLRYTKLPSWNTISPTLSFPAWSSSKRFGVNPAFSRQWHLLVCRGTALLNKNAVCRTSWSSEDTSMGSFLSLESSSNSLERSSNSTFDLSAGLISWYPLSWLWCNGEKAFHTCPFES